jgi:trk system potassium uptake protein TrkH
MIIVVSLDITFSNNADNFITSLRQSVFMVLAMASTSGFAIADTAVWPNLSILLLLYLSFQCGCSGSTTGGVKSDRILIFFKAFKAQLKKHVHPNAVVL